MREDQVIDRWLTTLRQRGQTDRQIAYAAKVLAQAAATGLLLPRHRSRIVREFVVWAAEPPRLNLELQIAGDAIQDEFLTAFRRMSDG